MLSHSLHTVEQVRDPAWLTPVLRASGRLHPDRHVVDIATVPMPGGVGLTSNISRLEVTDDDGTVQRLIAKSATTSPLRPFADASGVYDRELIFYGEFSAASPLPAPQAVFAARTADGSDFLILLEDLSELEGIKNYDQIDGLPIDDAFELVELIARFHHWTDAIPDPAKEKLPALVSFLSPVSVFVPQGWAQYLSVTKEDVPDDLTSIAERFPELLAHMLPADVACSTLVHGDLRADNVFRCSDGTFMLVDFQTFSRAPGIVDVAYLGALSVAGRPDASDHRRLLEAYVTARGQGPVTDELWRVYRLAVGAMLVLPAPAFLTWETSGERSREMTLVMFRRWIHAATQLGVPALLASR